MSSASAPDTASEAKRARGREWLLRAMFEAGLILLGLLGAFALDEWQDARAREARVNTLLAAIRAELETNLAGHAQASAFNTEIAEFVWNEGSKGVKFIPATALRNGLFKGPSLTSAAWTTAQNDAALSEIPIQTLLALARVYEHQRVYVDDFNTLLNNMYATVLEADDTAMGVDGIAAPLRLGGVLRDYAGRGRQLSDLYRATLAQLGIDPAAASPAVEAP